ncbi:MAG: bifunctional nicotinamidase/pyrazinamidase [Patescibacteria group bacterium]
MAKKALLMVDVQNDFCPGGALAVINGDKVVGPLNAMLMLADERNWLVVASRDWHPAVTTHFKNYGGIWPTHCVQNTPGAAFHRNLAVVAYKDIIISKATQPDEDGYSAFEGKTKDGKNLADVLKEYKIDEIYIGGLATDYCVKASALDAVKNSFKTFLLLDACQAVNIQPDDGDQALETMKNAGVIITTTQEVFNAR